MRDARLGISTLLLFAAAGALAEFQAQSFAAPVQQVQVPAAEAGVIIELLVEEGERVEQNAPLAKLDDAVIRASMEIARARSQASGQLKLASARASRASTRLRELERLARAGHARKQELADAKLERNASQAELQSAKENAAIAKLELERLHQRLQRRTIRAPITGRVVRVFKSLGEHIDTRDDPLLTLTDLSELEFVFMLPPAVASGLEQGQTVKLRPKSSRTDAELRPVSARVHFVSPIVEPESSTVRVKLRLDNKAGQYKSGASYTLALPSP